MTYRAEIVTLTEFVERGVTSVIDSILNTASAKLISEFVTEYIVVSYGSAAPTGGTWAQGDVVYDTTPSASSFIGWVCTASGTFSAATDATGDPDGSTAVIPGMTDTSDFAVGEFVTVSAGFPSSVTPYRILALTASSVTLEINSNSSQTNVTVATPDPVFKTWGVTSA